MTRRIMLLGIVFALGCGTAHAQLANKPSDSIAALNCDFSHPTCNGALLDVYNGSGTLASPPSAGTITVQSDAGAPWSPTSVMQSRRFANTPAGGAQLEYWGIPQGAKEIYVEMAWKPSDPFEGKVHGNNKMFFVRGKQPGTNGVFMYKKPQSTNPATSGIIIWTTQLANNLNQCFGAPDLDYCHPNVTTTPIFPGQWYRISARIMASTCPTCRDGRVRWWVNDILNGDYSNFAYGPSADFWLWAETWDGSGPVNEWVTDANHRLDHLHISYCMTGCAGSGGGGGPDTTPPGRATGLTITQLN